MNENKEYTKRQQKLLRQIQKTDKWYCRAPFIYIAYLFPVMFLASQLLKWSWLQKNFDYCLAIRLHGEVVPLDIEMNTLILWTVGSITFLLFIMSWMIVSIWQQQRTFKEILDGKDKKDS